MAQLLNHRRCCLLAIAVVFLALVDAVPKDTSAKQDKLSTKDEFEEYKKISDASFKQLDKNNDKLIDAEEIKGHDDTEAMRTLGIKIAPSTVLIHADEDGDAKIGPTEYEEWFEDHMELVRRIQDDWDKGDLNKDGKLTMEEYLQSPMGSYAATMSKEKDAAKKQEVGKAEYKRMDKDGDGTVAKSEFLWYVNPDDFGSADRNSDGFLDETEFVTAPLHWHDYEETEGSLLKEQFQGMDKDKDGKVSLKEYNDDLATAQKEDRELDEEELSDEDSWEDRPYHEEDEEIEDMKEKKEEASKAAAGGKAAAAGSKAADSKPEAGKQEAGVKPL